MSASSRPDARALGGEGEREVRGDGRLADAALAGGDGDDVRDLRQRPLARVGDEGRDARGDFVRRAGLDASAARCASRARAQRVLVAADGKAEDDAGDRPVRAIGDRLRWRRRRRASCRGSVRRTARARSSADPAMPVAMDSFQLGGGIVAEGARRVGPSGRCGILIVRHFFWSSHNNSRGRMGIFGGYRADRLIAEVRESGDPTSAKAKAALTKLQGLGQNAIKPIVDALATSDKRETVAFVEVLTPLIDNKSFPLLAKALAEENPRAVAGVAWALASSRNYSPGAAARAPADTRRLQARGPRRHRVAEEPLQPARPPERRLPAGPEREGRPVPDRRRAGGRRRAWTSWSRASTARTPIARTHIIALLARFDTPKVRAALQRTLKDPNKLVRAAALRAITNGSGEVDPALVAPLLRDPDSTSRIPRSSSCAAASTRTPSATWSRC